MTNNVYFQTPSEQLARLAGMKYDSDYKQILPRREEKDFYLNKFDSISMLLISEIHNLQNSQTISNTLTKVKNNRNKDLTDKPISPSVYDYIK